MDGADGASSTDAGEETGTVIGASDPTDSLLSRLGGLAAGFLPAAFFSFFWIWLSSGISNPAPHCGHTPRLPAKNALTFNLCEHVGQWNLIPIFYNPRPWDV
jgi:hypothetical protein